jgi:hypothetical protein
MRCAIKDEAKKASFCKSDDIKLDKLTKYYLNENLIFYAARELQLALEVRQ